MPIYYVGPSSVGSTGEADDNAEVLTTEYATEQLMDNAPVTNEWMTSQIDEQIVSPIASIGDTEPTGPTKYATQKYVYDSIESLPSLSYVNNPYNNDWAFKQYIPSYATQIETDLGSVGWVGVPALDANGQVAVSQVPPQGIGYVSEPIPPTVLIERSTTATRNPVAILAWNVGPVEFNFMPIVFASVAVKANMAQPAIYVTATVSMFPPAEFSPGINQTQIALGVGRRYFNGINSVSVFPAGPTAPPLPAGSPAPFQTYYPAQSPLYIVAWLADLTTNNVGVTLAPSGINSASLYLIRSTT